MKTSKKLLAIFIAVITVFSVFGFATAAEDKTVYVISGNINIDINTPIAGEKPSIDCSTSSNSFTVTAFTWYDKETGAIIDPAGTSFVYEDGGEYTAKITLTPAEDYKFADDIAVTVNDSSPSVIRFVDDTITVEVNFSCDSGTDGNSFLTGLKSVLLNILRIFRDVISRILGL